jgi:large subunit ribosomal protein L23
MKAKTVRDYQIIHRPRVTEKSSSAGASQVVFEVDFNACKDSIKAAVERVFNVEVASVNTAKYMGKVKRVGKSMGKTKSYKKAFITLKPGFTLDIVEGV